jgi:hypothetical protein
MNSTELLLLCIEYTPEELLKQITIKDVRDWVMYLRNYEIKYNAEVYGFLDDRYKEIRLLGIAGDKDK